MALRDLASESGRRGGIAEAHGARRVARRGGGRLAVRARPADRSCGRGGAEQSSLRPALPLLCSGGMVRVRVGLLLVPLPLVQLRAQALLARAQNDVQVVHERDTLRQPMGWGWGVGGGDGCRRGTRRVDRQ